MYSVADWGTSYQAPVGEEPNNLSQMFQYTSLSIQAGVGGANVFFDNDPSTSGGVVNYSLAEGVSQVVNDVRQGAIVTSTLPIQVHMLTGDVDNSPGYEYSAYTLFPKSAWRNSYWSPVSGALSGGGTGGSTYQTQITVFNSHAAPISVRCDFLGTGSADSTQSVAAGGVANWGCAGQFWRALLHC